MQVVACSQDTRAVLLDWYSVARMPSREETACSFQSQIIGWPDADGDLRLLVGSDFRKCAGNTTAARLHINNERCRTVANHLHFHLLVRGL